MDEKAKVMSRFQKNNDVKVEQAIVDNAKKRYNVDIVKKQTLLERWKMDAEMYKNNK